MPPIIPKPQPCPNWACDRETTAVCGCEQGAHCPGCAKVPDREPHSYQRLLTDEEIRQLCERS